MKRRYFLGAMAIVVVLSLHAGSAQVFLFVAVVVGLPFGTSVAPAAAVNLPGAGEVQSTVIPPGTKAQCPAGCLLISDDSGIDPGKIVRLSLDDLSSPLTPAMFLGELRPAFQIKSNDHDLITLNNGDVLYLRMGRSRLTLDPEPAWFDHAYKLGADPWGPGARSAILVWRSEDGGETFQFVSSIDTAVIDDDWGTPGDYSGGLPQVGSSEDPPGSPQQPIWQMGGTDGPLARVDRATGRVFAVIGLVGYLPEGPPAPFMIGGNPLKRSVVMMSSDGGDTWERAGALPFRGWRTDVVARANDVLAFGAQTFVAQAAIGQFPVPDVDPAIQMFNAPEPQGNWGWNALPWEHPILYKRTEDKDSTDFMKVNVAGQTILTRSPSSQKLLLAYMDTLEGNKGDGYRVYICDGTGSWTALPPIAPSSPDPDNFVLHLTAIDIGQGPILLYWYDVDTVTYEARIRGRFVTADNQWSWDFTIGASFDVTTAADWYGDYHTAGGYRETTSGAIDYNYYPVWIQPDGKVHFTRVQFRELTRGAQFWTRTQWWEWLRPIQWIRQQRAQPRATITHRELIDPSRLETMDVEEEEFFDAPRLPGQQR